MKIKIALFLLAAGLPVAALAQQVPAIENGNVRATYMPTGYVSSAAPTIPVLSGDSIHLNSKEAKAINLTNAWQSTPTMPVTGENGTVNFLYGATLPSVVCAPFYACDVALQAGEVVNQVDVGDAPRWKVTPATSGSGDTAVTHLVIKPADVGLATNMLVYTDRRTYNLRLVSKKSGQTPLVAFNYPEDTQAAWATYHKAHQAEPVAEMQPLQGNVRRGLSPTVSNSNLSFDYHLSGDNPNWKPVRVYSDANKTFIQFPESAKNSDIPALVLLGPGNQDQLVNYRLVNDRYVVDTVIDKAALVTGVGRHQQRVEIVREKS